MLATDRLPRRDPAPFQCALINASARRSGIGTSRLTSSCFPCHSIYWSLRKEDCMATAIQTASSTVTVNAAFLQEIKEVNEELWQLLDNLREICRSAAVVREHAAQLSDMLVEFRD